MEKRFLTSPKPSRGALNSIDLPMEGLGLIVSLPPGAEVAEADINKTVHLPYIYL
jgi:hypothetical protein